MSQKSDTRLVLTLLRALIEAERSAPTRGMFPQASGESEDQFRYREARHEGYQSGRDAGLAKAAALIQSALEDSRA